MMKEEDANDTGSETRLDDEQLVKVEVDIGEDEYPETEISQPDMTNNDQLSILSDLAVIKEELSSIKQEIQERLSYDIVKERAFERLYSELDELKRDAAFDQVRPLYTDLILFFDRIDNLSVTLPCDTITADDHLSTLTTFREELKEILYRRGVELVQIDRPEFDSALQRAVGTEETELNEEDGHVARVVRKGFSVQNQIFRPEEVIVKKFIPNAKKHQNDNNCKKTKSSTATTSENITGEEI